MSEIGDGIRPLPPIDRQKSEEEKTVTKAQLKVASRTAVYG